MRQLPYMHAARHPRLSSLRRLSAAGALCLFATGLLSSGLHLALVEHETCEHGDMVHRDALHDGDRNDAAPLGPALASSDHESHDHCSMPQRTPESATSVAPDQLTGLTPRTTMTATATVRPASVRVLQLYRLAPKGSPPA